MIASQAGLRPYAAVVAVGLFLVATVLEGVERRPAATALDVPFSVASRAFGISDSGDVVGLYLATDSRVRGFLLTGGVYTSIDVPGSIRTNAIGVAELRPRAKEDADGHDGRRADKQRRLAVVGRYDTPDPANPATGLTHGYVLRDGAFTTIDHPEAMQTGAAGAINTVAAGVNSSGHVVGRYRSRVDNQLHGFKLADGIFTDVAVPGPMWGIAISDTGDIAGYYGDANGRSHAFVRRNGVLTTIDPPDSQGTGQNGGVIGINAREVVGYYRFGPVTASSNGLRAFVYSLRDGSLETFALPDDARATCFFGINRRGDIVGNFVDADHREHGLLLQRRGQE